MNKTTKFSVLVAALLGMSAVAFAQTPGLNADNTVGYVIDQRGNVAKSGFGLCWRTPQWTPAMAIAECDPDLVKKAAMPAPAAAAAAPAAKGAGVAPAAAKASFNADAFFDFNKATLRAEGKASLDKLVNDIKGITIEVITATGHADRLGSDAYNQKLSEKRADAVKVYLISKGFTADRVYVEGKGEKQPKTSADECKGPKSKKVIDCLQKDRRVDIDVIGTKAK